MLPQEEVEALVMPILILADNRRITVPYNKAVHIQAILNNEQEPDNQEQADFVAQVAKVQFEAIHKPREWRNRRKPIEHDPTFDEIAANPEIVGIDKVKAVIERIQERL
jgi:hypothetical protein